MAIDIPEYNYEAEQKLSAVLYAVVQATILFQPKLGFDTIFCLSRWRNGVNQNGTIYFL